MMTQSGESIELVLGEGVRLRANFIWRNDRYAHFVTLIEPAGERIVLESIEGGPHDPWPSSPAFQQLSLQGEGDHHVALLVGMAGKSHWSMSVEVSPDQRGVVFDVACRMNTEAESLGSAYLARGFELVGPNEAVGPGSSHRCVVLLDPSLLNNSPLPNDSQSLSISALSVSADRLNVDCRPAPSPTPFTARWKYAVTVA